MPAAESAPKPNTGGDPSRLESSRAARLEGGRLNRLNAQKMTGEEDPLNQAARVNRLTPRAAGRQKAAARAGGGPAVAGRSVGAASGVSSQLMARASTQGKGTRGDDPSGGSGSAGAAGKGRPGSAPRFSGGKPTIQERMGKDQSKMPTAGPGGIAEAKDAVDVLKKHLPWRMRFWALTAYAWLIAPLMLPLNAHKLYSDREIVAAAQRIGKVNVGPAEKHPYVRMGKALARNADLIASAEWAIVMLLNVLYFGLMFLVIILIVVIGDCLGGVSNVAHCAFD